MGRVKIDYKNGESRTFDVENTADIEDAILSMSETIMFTLDDGTIQAVYIPNTIGINFEPEEIEVFGDGETE
ncbi:hypothetical protein PP655_gp117 [Bacillus phage PBC4]|uniref:Uncharacterized protein n=1 Tax=Bacillus phage PBC4 TaxID=1675028 RepID=A0A1D6X8G5_9CAUD|nr:hypothetical protein PP655_gp117 [Bacillus phage PBC4]AKQ08309.1 hypothetical protein PBC4_117 [Bacillus phage PBC4]